MAKLPLIKLALATKDRTWYRSHLVVRKGRSCWLYRTVDGKSTLTLPVDVAFPDVLGNVHDLGIDGDS